MALEFNSPETRGVSAPNSSFNPGVKGDAEVSSSGVLGPDSSSSWLWLSRLAVEGLDMSERREPCLESWESDRPDLLGDETGDRTSTLATLGVGAVDFSLRSAVTALMVGRFSWETVRSGDSAVGVCAEGDSSSTGVCRPVWNPDSLGEVARLCEERDVLGVCAAE